MIVISGNETLDEMADQVSATRSDKRGVGPRQAATPLLHLLAERWGMSFSSAIGGNGGTFEPVIGACRRGLRGAALLQECDSHRPGFRARATAWTQTNGWLLTVSEHYVMLAGYEEKDWAAAIALHNQRGGIPIRRSADVR